MPASTETYVLVLPWDPRHQGGVTSVVQQLEKSMAAAGWLRPIVAVNSWDDLVPRRSGPVWHLRMALTGSPSVAGVLKSLLLLPVVLWRLRTWLKAVEARAINFHYPGLAPLGVLTLKLLRLYRGRVILSFHGTDVRPPKDWLERWLRPLLHRHVDALVACSASLADRLSETLAVPRERVLVVHNGVDSGVFQPNAPPPPELPGPVPSSFLLNVASFVPGKDQVTLLGAFALLAERHPQLHMLMAGADGPAREPLQRDVEALGFRGRVRLMVGLSPAQVAYLLSKCRVCVQPSLSESFPLALLEAGAAGAAVVASRIAGHDEIIVEGVTGLMFPVRDRAACCAAIEAVLSDPQRAAAMAEAFRRDVVGRFTWSACADAYRRLALEA